MDSTSEEQSHLWVYKSGATAPLGRHTLRAVAASELAKAAGLGRSVARQGTRLRSLPCAVSIGPRSARWTCVPRQDGA
jgi:predicted DNA-binding transcriptional regulator AlpA